MADRRAIAGYGILAVLIIVAAACAFVAFSRSGEMGIEERFSSAMGQPQGRDISDEPGPDQTVSSGTNELDDHKDDNGFTIEGNRILYLAILIILAAACVLAYRKFRI